MTPDAAVGGAALADDVAAVIGIEAVYKTLEVVRRSTGMGFSAVARVTDTKWVTCAVRDERAFGSVPGSELELASTLCNDTRQSGQSVVINDVAADARFCRHPAPAKFGFQSCVSVPIRLPSGEFFRTLCATDPRLHRVDTPETVGMFQLYADVIGLHLEAGRRAAAEGVAHDVAAERLDRLRSVFESAKDYAVISVDLHGRIDGWN